MNRFEGSIPNQISAEEEVIEGVAHNLYVQHVMPYYLELDLTPTHHEAVPESDGWFDEMLRHVRECYPFASDEHLHMGLCEAMRLTNEQWRANRGG